MNPKGSHIILGAALFGFATAVTSAPPSTVNSAAAATVDAFEAALVKGDGVAAQALLAPDVLIYESGGQESSRAEYASQHLKSDMAFLAGSQRELLSRTGGGDERHAWVSTRSRLRAHHGGKLLDLLSTESMMLKNTPQGWRIVHIHWSSQPAAKAQ